MSPLQFAMHISLGAGPLVVHLVTGGHISIYVFSLHVFWFYVFLLHISLFLHFPRSRYPRHEAQQLTVTYPPTYSDYINPIDLCNRLNTYIIPEAAVHGFLTFLFLINGYWVALVLNLPLLAWNIKKYDNSEPCRPYPMLDLRAELTLPRIVDNTHLLDATEIFRKLNVHKKVWALMNRLIAV